MKCKKCKAEMQIQVVSETRERTLAEKLSHAGKMLTFGFFRREKPLPVIAVTYAVCPKCGKTVKLKKKKGLFGHG